MNERDGVLVLSENAGAHEELGALGADGESRSTWPARPRALYEALTMGEDERRRRLEAIQAPGARARHRRLDRAQLADLEAAVEHRRD